MWIHLLPSSIAMGPWPSGTMPLLVRNRTTPPCDVLINIISAAPYVKMDMNPVIVT